MRRQRPSRLRSGARRSKCPELGESHFDRVHVGRVGRQQEELGAGGGDRGAYWGGLVSRQVVHHDDVVGFECRGQHLLGISEERLAGHRPSSHHRRGQAIVPERGEEGDGLPVAERRLGQQARVTRRATVEPGHLGASAGLVDKDKLVGVDEVLRRPADPAPGGDI